MCIHNNIVLGVVNYMIGLSFFLLSLFLGEKIDIPQVYTVVEVENVSELCRVNRIIPSNNPKIDIVHEIR